MLGRKRLNDKQLVDAIANGDKDAMVQLYKDNYVSIRNYVLKNNGSSDDAEDVLQDATIVVWEKCRAGRFELSSRLSTFLFAVAKNLWLKRLNKMSRQVQMTDKAYENLSDSNDDFHIHDRQKVVEMMQNLGEKCRELLALFYFDGLDMNSIAEQMGYNNSDTVKAKKHQCFKQLQEQFVLVYRKQDFLEP